MCLEQFVKYFGKKYDIDGNVYELIATMPVSRDLVFQSVNDDYSITRNIKNFDLENYVKES